ncbi:MAG: hypothetical protein Q9160_003883 [Pyrenula sp. 1 TL-2023]
MEVQFRDGMAPQGAPDPRVTKLINLVDEDGIVKSAHSEAFWNATDYLGGESPKKRGTLTPRDDPYDNICLPRSWDAFKRQVAVLYETVVAPMFRDDGSLTGIEYNLVDVGRKAVYQAYEGGSARLRFWVSANPTLKDTASYHHKNFHTGPNCESQDKQHGNSVDFIECFNPPGKARPIRAPTLAFWNRVSDECRKTFHNSLEEEANEESMAAPPNDPPKPFTYDADPAWKFEYKTDGICNKPFLCSAMFGKSGDGQRGAARQHWDTCKTTGPDGGVWYYGGIIHPNVDTTMSWLESTRWPKHWSACGGMILTPKMWRAGGMS